MPLTSGDRIGPYQVLSPIGKGGMGEVYRARDTKLDRDVAIKVLPAALMRNIETLARFEREAKLLASLNHPNIAQVYGIEDSNDTRALVMELIDGLNLADRIKQGAIPMDESLAIARQITSALEAAHEKGIVHRDLKPGNIMITPVGIVKVLDFGLAKLTAPKSADSMDAENSPTLTMGMTEAGMILGTAAYMSPEQARGQNVDKRSDIWSFGVVLFEMLTGKRLFVGETMADILAGVLKHEPGWTAVPFETRRLLMSCLEKEPRNRLRDVGDVWKLLDTVPEAQPQLQELPPPRPKSTTLWRAAALVLLIVVLVGGWWSSNRAPTSNEWSGELLGGPRVAFYPRISPDGQTLAFQAMVDGLTQVAVMKPDSGNWQILTHDRTHGYVSDIAWPPDGSRVYFSRFQDVPRGIYTIPVFGGDERLVLEDAQLAEVLKDGSLLIIRLNSGRRRQLHRYWPETGRLLPLNALLGISDIANTRATPRGQAVFFGTPLDKPDAQDHVYALDLESGKSTRLAPGFSFAGTAPSLAIGPDGASVVLDMASGDARRFVSVPIGGSGDVRTLIMHNERSRGIDIARDGSLYIGTYDRNGEVLRVSPSGANREYISSTITTGNALALPLPDGRIVFNSRKGSRSRLMVAGPGKEPAPFVETQDQTLPPATVVGQGKVAFVIGEGPERTIGLVSIADGRMIGRLSGTKGVNVSSIASSPDGGSIYYTAAGSVWMIPVGDGSPKKIHSGDEVTVDPYRKDLIIELREREANRLVRVPLAGGADQAIPIQTGIHPASSGLDANSVGRDGKILIQVTTPGSWFWPTGLLDPQTGHVQILQVGYDADMDSAGWTPDGNIVMTAAPLRAVLWRWRQAGKE